MKTIYFNKETQFELTDEEFVNALEAFDEGRRVYISRLEVSLSPNYLWAGEKPEVVDPNERWIDGGKTRVIKKFGTWVMADMPEVKIDLSHYPELKETPKSTSLKKY